MFFTVHVPSFSVNMAAEPNVNTEKPDLTRFHLHLALVISSGDLIRVYYACSEASSVYLLFMMRVIRSVTLVRTRKSTRGSFQEAGLFRLMTELNHLLPKMLPIMLVRSDLSTFGCTVPVELTQTTDFF